MHSVKSDSILHGLISPGDVVLAVNGTEVQGSEAAAALIAQRGGSLILTVRRPVQKIIRPLLPPSASGLMWSTS